MISVTLPAPNGTTMVTRWVGKFCAAAGAGSSKVATTSATTPGQNWRSLVIAVLLRFALGMPYKACGGVESH